MPPPVLSSFAQRIYDSLSPVAQDDAGTGYDLAQYCAAMGRMFQLLDDYARDQGNAPGWSQLVDIDRCPVEALPWLGQFVGVVVPIGLTVAQQRAWISNTAGFNRGTLPAMIAAAQAYLTGTQSVTVTERDGDPYLLTITTISGETPDANKVRAALLSQKPAGIILTYSLLDGQTYAHLFVNKAAYSNVFTDYPTYQDLLNDNPPAAGPVPGTMGYGTIGSGTMGG